MDQSDGLIFAYVLDGQGGGRELDWQGVRAWSPRDGVLWVHLDRTGDQAQSWVTDETGIDRATTETLLLPMATRPRVHRIGDGLLVVLRGINFNPGDAHDDMVGLHMWIDAHRIITLRRRRLMAGGAIRDLLLKHTGPRNSSDFLSEVAEQLLQPIVPIISDLDDAVDEVQTELLASTDRPLRQRLHKIRQEAISLRRYLAPPSRKLLLPWATRTKAPSRGLSHDGRARRPAGGAGNPGHRIASAPPRPKQPLDVNKRHLDIVGIRRRGGAPILRRSAPIFFRRV